MTAGLAPAVLAGGAALHGIVQDLLQAFEAEVPPHLSQANSGRHHTAVTIQTHPKSGWQGKAAAAVIALTELLYGASSVWQCTLSHPSGNSITHSSDSHQGLRHNDLNGNLPSDKASGTQANSAEDCGNTQAGRLQQQQQEVPASSASDAGRDNGALEQLVAQVLDDFGSAGVWQLPTHVDADAAIGASGPLTPQVNPCPNPQPL